MTIPTIPTPNFDEALAGVRAAVSGLKPAVHKDIKAAVQHALDEAIAANGSVAQQAQGTPQGSPKRQRLADNQRKLAQAARTINDPYADDDALNEILAILQALTAAALASQPTGQSQPVDPEDIANRIVDKLAPRLAPPAPTPAPVPEPERQPLDTDAIAAKVLEGFTPFLATGEDGKPTKAASEASVTDLASRMTRVEQTNVALGLVLDEQGRHTPAPGTFAYYTANGVTNNGVVWIPAVIVLAVTIVLAVIVGFLTVLGPVYATWIAIIGVLAAIGTLLFNNRNRSSR